jgi:Holliday junction resolvase RusA-like endonuclease
MPPSSNDLYRVFRGGLIKSQAARAYEARAKLALLSQLPFNLPTLKNCGLGLTITLEMPNLENKGWPKSCETRYKRQDGSNRIKLLEDIIADVLGIDDSQFLELHVLKCARPRAAVQICTVVLEPNDQP